MMSLLTFFESLWHLTLAGYLASPWELTSLLHSHPVWWPKQHESVWATLQDAERFAALPAVQRKVLANNAWHYPGLPAHSSRPILCPPSIPSDSSRDPTGRKRALNNAHTPDVPSGEPAGDREPRFNVKRFCLEDPNRLTHVMRRALAISESPRDLMEVDEATKTQPSVVCCLGNGYEDVWVLGQPNAPNTSVKSKGGKNTKVAPSRC
ncbi:hypothetical protein FS749_015419 [Ceratobasidium sp. UAMH 11750]|nr:hypothetical protein FS749_015419 [Ceratobasidium sp. UAMH 11750]